MPRTPALATLFAAFSAALAVAAACSAGRVDTDTGLVTFPAHFAEGQNEDGGSRDAAVASDGKAARTPPNDAPPDPEPLRLARQYEYEIVYDAGKVRVASVRRLLYSQPIVTSREMGRWAIELWIGHELIERVRFEFPLLGAEEPRTKPRRPLQEPPSFAEGAHVSRKVLVPASPRATRAVLVDRATGDVQVLPWPPDAPIEAPGDSRK
jgi:hypothetical protein